MAGPYARSRQVPTISRHIARVPGRSLPGAGEFDFAAFRKQQHSTSEGAASAFVPGDVWRDAQRQWYEEYEFYRAMTEMSRLGDEARVALLRNVAAYSWFARTNARYAKEEYSALSEWAHLPSKARRQLLREFENSRQAR
jgi:hypothetical protein